MGFLTDHPHTAVTDTIERVCSSEQFTLEVELASLIQQIRAGKSDYENGNNQIEAARCLRKKLKYGNRLQQARALELMNLFVSQRIKFPEMYNDAKLLDRLRVIAMQSGTDGSGQRYHPRIIKKCVAYILGWSAFLDEQGPSRSYEGLDALARKVKSKYTTKPAGSRRRKGFMSDKADASIMSADDRYGIPHIDMTKEAPKIRLLISDSLATAVSLKNTLMTLPRTVNSTDDEEATARFVQARAMRRKVLRYLQLVTEGEFLGSLLHANEELVASLSAYDELSGNLFEEESLLSENDDDEDDDEVSYLSSALSTQPERCDSNDPFGDQNRI
ncbi:Lsb5p [Lachancea thermotolerans CBS 6340]|uniref:KLTH0F01298p n=1 Tax=Lachancea thermotolerans (strain ATCC 56472 / CBS 6340 / NRRL Y-8284) TaxID=559295 RepID=C5DK28_LACTC|nr:KLTH0F01298p [Lachancea thermotolerans CBS 6340]CAR23829.1 KLTH0F01298p [Lachancea thermotolerans CBS 6340]